MSIHPSLRQAGGKIASRRNVLKRFERLRLLMSQGRWPEGRSIFGMPKIKQEKIRARKAAPKEAAAEATPAAGAAAAPAAKAAGGKPAAKPAA